MNGHRTTVTRRKGKVFKLSFNKMHDNSLVSSRRDPKRLKKGKRRINSGNNNSHAPVLQDFYRQLQAAWKSRAGQEDHVTGTVVMSLFHDLQLYPSRAQVTEMLKCASQVSNHDMSLTFPEFCVFATEFKRINTDGNVRRVLLSRFKDRRKPLRCNNKNGSKWEVFLGGSCNPTTWRHDTAIPTLNQLGITFYNPQVSNWEPALIELEAEAKNSASVVFFVIDRETRAIVSCIEAAYMAGYHKKLVLVLEHLTAGQELLGERILPGDFSELSQTRSVLESLVEKQDIPVLSSLEAGLRCVNRLIKGSCNVTQLSDGFTVKMGYVPLAEKLIKLRETFNTLDSSKCGVISMGDVMMLYEVVCQQELTSDLLSPVSSLTDVLDFQSFCRFLTEFRHHSEQGHWFWDQLINTNSIYSIYPPNKIESNGSTDGGMVWDLYLGSSSSDSPWRESIAIPLLKASGVSYECSVVDRLLPEESATVDSCRVLLWVITDSERAASTMCLAAHYIAMGCRVVLCIQTLPETISIDGEQLNASAVKDYNRGRSYLANIAKTEGVPVYESIQDAVQAAIHMCKGR